MIRGKIYIYFRKFCVIKELFLFIFKNNVWIVLENENYDDIFCFKGFWMNGI